MSHLLHSDFVKSKNPFLETFSVGKLTISDSMLLN